jgi:Domain of unknown function (DUF4351)
MTRTHHDLFAKQHLEALLEPMGVVSSSHKVISETREVDVWFVPNPDEEDLLEALGLLGQMAKQSCILEPFRKAIQSPEILSCIGKLIDLSEELRRQAKRSKRTFSESARPRLWLLSPTVSKPVLESFGSVKQEGWPAGCYGLPTAFRTGVIAIHQLPVNEQTLWLRLMGRDTVQRQAIAELLALPKTHPMKQRTIEHLAVLRINIETRDNLNEDERDLAMNLTPVYEEWRQKTLEEGKQEGRQEGELTLVLRQLTRRFGAIRDGTRSQINQLPVARLEDLGEALLDFSSAADLEDWLRRSPQ